VDFDISRKFNYQEWRNTVTIDSKRTISFSYDQKVKICY